MSTADDAVNTVQHMMSEDAHLNAQIRQAAKRKEKGSLTKFVEELLKSQRVKAATDLIAMIVQMIINAFGG